MNRRIFRGIVIVSVGTTVVLHGLVKPALARHMAENDSSSLRGRIFAAAYQLAGGN